MALSFFGGGWWDGAASTLLGSAVGALGFLAGRSTEDRRLLYAYEFLSAALCALLVRCMDVLVPTCYEAVVLSALIWLLQARLFLPPPRTHGDSPQRMVSPAHTHRARFARPGGRGGR